MEEFAVCLLLVGARELGLPARALQDGLLEGDGALSAAVCGDLVDEGAGSCGDTHDGDAGGIAAEEVDVGLDPF